MSVLDRIAISKEVRSFLDKRRPPEKLRPKLDFGFRFHNRTVELFEIRPRFGGRGEKIEHAFAKATFVGTRGLWKVYWMRGNLKWHPYEPHEVESLEDFLNLVGRDRHGCFFG